MSKTVEFFYDFSSPYSYLAATRMSALEKKTGAKVIWKPFLLGAVFKAAENQSPMMNKGKFKNLIVDIGRWAQIYKVPLAMPATFPINTVKAMRMAVSLDDKAIQQFSLKAFEAYWASNLDITKDEELLKIAKDCGLDGAALLKRAGDQDVKDKLRENTDGAIARGAFGAPTFFVGDAMFWGNDRVEMMEMFLKGELA